MSTIQHECSIIKKQHSPFVLYNIHLRLVRHCNEVKYWPFYVPQWYWMLLRSIKEGKYDTEEIDNDRKGVKMASLAKWGILELVYRLKIDTGCSKQTSSHWCSRLWLAWTRTGLALAPKAAMSQNHIYHKIYEIFVLAISWKLLMRQFIRVRKMWWTWFRFSSKPRSQRCISLFFRTERSEVQ